MASEWTSVMLFMTGHIKFGLSYTKFLCKFHPKADDKCIGHVLHVI